MRNFVSKFLAQRDGTIGSVSTTYEHRGSWKARSFRSFRITRCNTVYVAHSVFWTFHRKAWP